MNGRRRRFIAATSSMGDFRIKFSRIVSHHQQLKLAFNQLDTHIRTGLQEAADVFESLANPLMKLVGLKTVEMAEQGKYTTVVIDYPTHFYANDCKRNENRAETRVRKEASEIEEEGYMTRAKTVGKELIQKQEMQLRQLIHLLRQVESQVNTSQTNILQTLSDHQTSIHSVFKKAVAYVSAIHQRGENNGTSLITIQLLKHIFRLVITTLSSVECRVDTLVDELATRMYRPMVDYVKGLKLEVTSGRCHRLLNIVEEMGGAMRTGRTELEEARKKARLAEHNRREALYKLKESEELARKYQGFKNGSKEQFEQEKLAVKDQDHAKEDSLLWDLLKKKRKLGMGNGSSKPCGLPLSQLKELGPQTPRLAPSSSPTYSSNGHRLLPMIPLGTSPSVTYPQHRPQKKIKSGFHT
ncbi:uncharacterized protein LOC132040595 isoform X1 [Lycium ferocissimum]|uniref:uncharacterized protein LOC132040595 isoform X1 n=1 Tax=Lycium ferocissimum TaxID=112874 RepID=UPI0028161074|nr:uncharacterized protein LOC132040595 isoform X1 [Lycium ferocissimum]